jgi:hypothetical protein
MIPATLVKAWLAIAEAEDVFDWKHSSIVSVLLLSVLLPSVFADIRLIWIFNRGWMGRSRWIWPSAIFLSLPSNAFLGMCCGLPLFDRMIYRFDMDLPEIVLMIGAQLGLASCILMVITCHLADRDRRRLGNSP